MRAITKGREPDSLVECRSARPKLKYTDYRDLDTLRQCLVREQRGLCCYCMCRIRPTKDDMKVEHWHSQDSYPLETLDYRNLLGACTGNEGKRPADQHCDTSKGNQNLSRNPASPAHHVENFIQYGRTDGALSSQDPQFDRELNEVLHLNIEALRNRRLAAIDILIQSLPKRQAWPEAVIRKELQEWNGESHKGELEPYCQVVVHWVRKWLKRHDVAI